MLTARTRQMLEVTLVRANIRTAYRLIDATTSERLPDDTSPSSDVTCLQAFHVRSAVKGERSDGWLALDSTDAVVGALCKWEGQDDGWTAYHVRSINAVSSDTAARLTDAQRKHWAHAEALDRDTLADIIARGAQGALLSSGTGIFDERSRAAAMNRAGWVQAR